MGTPLDELVDLLDLEQIEVNIFRGRSPDESRQRVFGGQVAGQALVAAGRTVDPDRHVHSLHAYFLRPGDPSVPIVYEVDRIRDGRSFTTRRVVAVQHGKAIFNLSASFQIREEGLEHQDADAGRADPESLPTMQERLEAARLPTRRVLVAAAADRRALRRRPAVAAAGRGRRAADRQHGLDARRRRRCRDDPLLHVCVVTYASDMTLLDSVLMAHGLSWQSGRIIGASLDHAMWFHRPFRADEWLLYVQESPTSSGAPRAGPRRAVDPGRPARGVRRTRGFAASARPAEIKT